MSKVIVSSLMLWVFWGSVTSGFPMLPHSGVYQCGLSAEELRQFAESIPELPGRIQAIRLFRQPKSRASAIAIVTFGQKTGWRVLVFARGGEKGFHLEWSSGELEDSFQSSWPDALRVVDFVNEQVIQFEGCAARNCPDAFSILIYAPSKRTAFKAHSVMGKITYSANLEVSSNRSYKEWLANQIAEREKERR